MKSQDKKFDKLKAFCIVCIVLASLLIIFSFCGRFFDGTLRAIANFFVGSFGMSFYGLMVFAIATCALILTGKTFTMPKKYIANFAVMYVLIICIVHSLTTTVLSSFNYNEYIKYCFDYYTIPNFGGVVFGTICFGLSSAISLVGSLVVFFGGLIATIVIAVNFLYDYSTNRLILDKDVSEVVNTQGTDTAPSSATQNVVAKNSAFEQARAILFDEKPVNISNVQQSHSENSYSTGSYPYVPQSTLDTDNQNGKTKSIDILFGSPTTETEPSNDSQITNDFFGNAPVSSIFDDETDEHELNEDDIINTEFDDQPISNKTEDIVEQIEQPQEPSQEDVSRRTKPRKRAETPVEPKIEPQNELDSTDLFVEPENVDGDDDDFVLDDDDSNELEIVEMTEPIGDGLGQVRIDIAERGALQKAKVHQYLSYNSPPLELLDDEIISAGMSQDELLDNCIAIVKKLEVFGIKTEFLPPVVGPSVTQYRLRPLSDKTRMNSFSPYADDLKSCLEAKGEIRISAPIPGTNLVGIEVENRVKRPVVLRTLLQTKEFTQSKGHLNFVIGQDISGEYITADLGKMPHLLIAGTTGSGKSVALNAMIVSMMYKYSPEYLRFIMIDPKIVELSRYNGSPHLLTTEAITSVQDSIASLDYLIKEMNSRYLLMKQYRSNHIDEYNSKINPKLTPKLPYIVLVVDELADIILTAGKTFESKLAMIAQKSRAAGIHIVLSTQRPSKEIVTGVIKANIPCKMALKVSSRTNSQIILDTNGAETLVGNGDMLYMDGSSSELKRIQGCYVSREEIDNIVQFCIKNNEIYYEDDIETQIFASKNDQSDENEEEQAKKDEQEGKKHFDSYCKRALHFWLTKNKGLASISSIQRHLGIGFNRAGKIQDSLIAEGYVEDLGDSESNNRSRRVLVTLDQLDTLFPDQTLSGEE